MEENKDDDTLTVNICLIKRPYEGFIPVSTAFTAIPRALITSCLPNLDLKDARLFHYGTELSLDDPLAAASSVRSACASGFEVRLDVFTPFTAEERAAAPRR